MTTTKQLMSEVPESPDTPAKEARRRRAAKKATDAPDAATAPETKPAAKRPAKKAAAPKKPPKPMVPGEFANIVIKTEMVKCAELHPFYKNPRIGNVNLIARSLHTNGQFKPIVVNIGSYTGRQNEILAGNHTFKGAKKELVFYQDGKKFHKLPWEEILVSWVDVAEDVASRIVLADNRTGDDSSYDDKVLAELFRELPDAIGTGYTAEDMDNILSQFPTTEAIQAESVDFEDMLTRAADPATDRHRKPMTKAQEIAERRSKEIAEANAERQRRIDAGEVDEDDEDAVEEANAAQQRSGRLLADFTEPEELDDVDLHAELQVLLEAKEETIYPFDNYLGIPVLQPDQLVTEADISGAEFKTWGGKDASRDDMQSFWIWNTGLASLTGLPKNHRTILGFFTYDVKFEKWWTMPAYHTAKAISYGIKYAFVPDYSIWLDDPRALHMYNTYRGYWLGRFFQDAGLKVIPTFFSTDLESLKYVLNGIPEGTDYISMSAQATTEKEMKATQLDRQMDRMIDQVKPKNVIVYAGNPGHQFIRSLDLENRKGVNVIYVLNYAGVRRGNVFDKKLGAAKLTAKQKKEIRQRAEKRAMERMEVSSPDELEEEDFEEDDFLTDEELAAREETKD